MASRIVIDCLYCIDQMMPAGHHPILGPIYRFCPYCDEPCPTCHGSGVFAAVPAYFELLADALCHVGVAITTCRDCWGVTDIRWENPR